MDDLTLEGTAKTPEVNFRADKGTLELLGKSIPENSLEFYKPIYDWIDAYSRQPAKTTEVKIQLEYFNTSSSKCLLDIFRKLEALNKSAASTVNVTWMYEEEDEDMMEAGDDYKTLVNMNFSIEKISS